MIENVTAADQYLYHYTKASTAQEHILREGTLRLSSYVSTNDPKEAKTWQFDLATQEGRNLGNYNMPDDSAWLSNQLKRGAKLACFSMDTPSLTGNHLQDIFRRGFCKPRMWAQYAEGHSGVCLVFDREKLSKTIDEQIGGGRRILSGPVKYIDRSIIPNLRDDQQYTINVDALETVGRDEYPGLHLKMHHSRLFFEKMADWQNEREWRWVVFANADEDLYVRYGDALVGIVFGENTRDEAVQEMLNLTKSWSIRCTGLKWKNCSPWYDFANPRYWHRGISSESSTSE